MSDSSEAPASTGERPQSILAEAAKISPIPVSGKQGPAPKFSFGPLSQRDMVDLSKPASAIEGTRSSLAGVGRPTPMPTSASGSGTTYQPSAKPISSGTISQDRIEPSNAPSPRPISTPSSSSSAHQSSPQHFRFGPYAPAPAHQTRNQRAPAQDRLEAQAARIKALESGFNVVTERYEKASALADKYEGLLETVEKEYLDKITASDNNNMLVLRKVAGYETQIKALQEEKRTLEKLQEMSVRDVSEWGRKHSSLMDTNKEQAAKISSLTKTQAVLRNELTSSLTTIEEMKEKIGRLTDSDRKWEDLVGTMEKDKVELRTKSSENERQIEEYSMIVSALHETRTNLERELRGSLQILELLETDDSLGLVGLVKDEGEDEPKKFSIGRSEKEGDDGVAAAAAAAAAVHDGQEEALPPAKELEEASLLSAPAGSSSEMMMEEEESSEKRVNQFCQDLWFLALLLLYYATVFVVVWKFSFEEWVVKSGIDIERAFFLLRIWIFDLGNRLFGGYNN